MLNDFDVKTCTRTCATSGVELQPGQVCYSVIKSDGAETVREDYSAEHWQQPNNENEEALILGWWRFEIPDKDDGKVKLAPNEVLLNLFVELADQAEQSTFRYVLGLLLIRRRVLTLQETLDEPTGETMVLACNRRSEEYRLPVETPSTEQAEQMQERINQLLYAG
ncbi:MAG: hypothetical protein RH917_11135 [Lacipirellulaceae bacterium]